MNDSMRLQFPGPFSHHEVVLDGWAVPLLTAGMVDESHVMLILDHRIAITLTVDEAERMTPFVADCISAALGYGAHPAPDAEQPLPRAPLVRPVRMHQILGMVEPE